jgi:hypothetical protein
MAIKEFIISPENYFEDEFFDGDYTERQNQSFSTLTCNANRIVSIQIETGVYFAEGYFDDEYTERQSQSFATLVCEIDKTVGFLFQAGFYFEQGFIEDDFVLVNSIVTTLEVEAMVVQEATIIARDYFDGSYYEPGYYADSGSRFTFSIYLGQTVEAAGSISATATVDAVVGVVKSATANVSAEFSCTGTISHIEGADLFAFTDAALAAAVEASRDYEASLESIFDIATDYIRIKQLSADADIEFTQSAEGARSRDFDSVIEAAVSLDCDLNVIKDTSVSLTSAIIANASVGVIFSLVSNLNSSANINVNGNIITRRVVPTVYEEPFYDEIDFTTDKVFGSHSVRLRSTSDQISPISNVVHNGSVYKIFEHGYTWTSNDGLTWTRTTNNLTNGNYADFQNNLYIVGTGGATLSYSSDGTTWTQVTISIAGSYTANTSALVYSGGFWYVVAGQFGGTHSVFRNTALQSGSWTNVSSGSNYSVVSDVKRYGTRFVFGYQRSTSYGGSINRTVVATFVPGGTIIDQTSTANIEGVVDVAYDGTNYYLLSASGLNRYLRRGSTLLGTWNVTDNTAPNQIDYFGSRFILQAENGVHIETSGFSSDSSPAISNVDTILTTPSDAYISYVNSRLFVLKSLVAQEAILTTTNDFTNYTDVTIDSLESINSSRIEYTNANFNNWKTIDLRIRIDDATVSNPSAYLFNLGESYFSIMAGSAFGRIGLNESDSFGNLNGLTFLDRWYHLRYLRNGSEIKVYVDGVLRGTKTVSIADSSTIKIFSGFNSGQCDIRIDEFLVSNEFLNPYANSSFTVPTQGYENDTDTLLLLHFDNDFVDDAVPPVVANLVVTSTLTVVFGKTADAISLQASSGTLTANANVVNDAISNQSSEFQIVAEGEFVAQEANASIESASTLVAEAVVTRSTSSSIQSESTVNATATRIFDFDIETDSVAILLSAVAKVGDFLVTLENSAQLSADVVKTTDVNSTIEAVTAFVAQGDKTVAFEATIDASVDISIIGDRIRFADSDQTASFVHSITAIKNTQGAVNLDSAFDIDIDSAGLIGGNAALISNFDLDVNFDRTRDLNSNLNSEFTQTATGIKAVEADATLNSESTISITVLRIRSASTNFDSIAVQLAAVAKIGDFLIDCQTDSQLTVDAIKQAVGVTNIEVFAQQNTVIARTRDTDASLTSEFTNVANVRTTTDVVADLDSNFEQSVTAQKIISAQVNISGAAQFAATVVATRNNEIQTFTQSQLTLTPDIIRNNSASIAAQANQTVTAQRVRTTASSINSTTAVTANGRIIVIDKYEYIIPREYREFAIHAENRQYRIVKENREHIVRG